MMIDITKTVDPYENLVGWMLIRAIFDYDMAMNGRHDGDPRVNKAIAWVDVTSMNYKACRTCVDYDICQYQDNIMFTYEHCCEVMGINSSILRGVLQCDEARPAMVRRLKAATTSYRTSKSLKRSYRKRQEEREV
jgi:hypothetical protein